jgi:hypothetical protein
VSSRAAATWCMTSGIPPTLIAWESSPRAAFQLSLVRGDEQLAAPLHCWGRAQPPSESPVLQIRRSNVEEQDLRVVFREVVGDVNQPRPFFTSAKHQMNAWTSETSCIHCRRTTASVLAEKRVTTCLAWRSAMGVGSERSPAGRQTVPGTNPSGRVAQASH